MTSRLKSYLTSELLAIFETLTALCFADCMDLLVPWLVLPLVVLDARLLVESCYDDFEGSCLVSVGTCCGSEGKCSGFSERFFTLMALRP